MFKTLISFDGISGEGRFWTLDTRGQLLSSLAVVVPLLRRRTMFKTLISFDDKAWRLLVPVDPSRPGVGGQNRDQESFEDIDNFLVLCPL